MEILKRAKGDSGDLASFNHSEKDIKEEVNLRTWKAGYTTRDGNPLGREKISAGWSRKFEENYKRIRS